MQAHELKKHLNSLTNEILEVSAHIIAETATTYYKESFRRKGFDGRQWKPPKHPKSKGSLMVDSSALMNFIMVGNVRNLTHFFGHYPLLDITEYACSSFKATKTV